MTKNQNNDWIFLAQAIKKASEEIIGVTTTHLSGWLEPHKETVIPLVKQQRRTLNKIRNDPSIPTAIAKEMWINARKHLREAIKLAKSQWMANLAQRVQTMRLTPKEAWKAFREVQKGVTGHHAKPMVMRFKMSNGPYPRTKRNTCR